MTTTKWLAGLIVFLAALGWPACSRAHELDPKKYEPGAVQLLDEVVRAYKDLPSYTDDGKLYLKSEINGNKSHESNIMRIAFSRQPDKLMMHCAPTRFFCDGSAATSVLDLSRAYMVFSLPANWRMTPKSIATYPGAASIMAGVSGLPPSIILDLLNSGDARKAILLDTDGLRLENPPADANPAYKYLLVDQQQGPDILLFIEPSTKRVVEMRLKLDPSQLFERTPPGLEVSNATFGWESGKISTETVDPNVFTFKPPADYTKINNWAAAVGLAGQFDPRVGKPAPVFTLHVLDGPDRTKSLRTADLQGKIVLIVIWASWSPPCFNQLRWVKKELVDRYRDRGVVMLSVNIDDDARDVDEARQKVVRTLKEKGLALDEPPFSYVALDPTNSVGQHVQLKNIPTTFVVDRDGTVRFFFSGFKMDGSEPTPERLEKLMSVGSPAPADATSPRQTPP